MKIACLPMYHRPELNDAHQRYWQLIAGVLNNHGIDAPEQLCQHQNLQELWLDKAMLMSQTCGMPYRLGLVDKVSLIGTPDYGVAGCPPGHYCSVMIIRRDDPRASLADFANARFAYNQRESQSGFAAPYQHCRTHGFWFDHTIATGAHVAAAQAVMDHQADIAAIDAVTWELLQRYENMESLRVLLRTEPTPGLPYITALDADSSLLFDAVATAIDALSEDDRSQLMLRGIVKIPPLEYLAVPNPDI
ncbi:MAG: PhnD/SsuA/transferrin family substrate-binding protein [Pseudomonadota bacterium]